MSRFDREAGEPAGSGVAASAGLAVLVVGASACRDESLRRSLARSFAVAEFVEDPAGAERLLPRCHFDCIVAEADSAADPVLGWLETVANSAAASCVCLCGPDGQALAPAGRRIGATVLPAPLQARALQQMLARARPLAATRRGPVAAEAPLGASRTRLVGDSEPIRRVRDIVARVAPTPATVLIEGQTGTGKELVARLLHELSGRRGPFVPVNCGAIPPELMESELFGHARGAFTGAHQQREGLFVAARGGTLFLDEVSEMRSDLQVKLLRALEEGAIRPVGADREVPIDVRIVASSQPGLRERVQGGGFREDLYYRLNVVHVALPSLRDRPGDVPQLVRHFMLRVADEFGMTPVELDAAAFVGLQSREWPGNVRELRNFVERTVLMGAPPQEETAASAVAEPASPGYPLDWTLEDVKQAHILRVLEHNDGNRSATARQLGVSRKTLERRLGSGDGADD